MAQLRPGNAAGADVGHDAARERPAFEVPTSKSHIQPQRIAGGNQPVSQLDIFNRRTPKALVEAANRSKGVRADGSQSCPERRGAGVADFMHIGMRQVLVLRHEVALRRKEIVRAEYALK